jgi:hypothetical protein
LGESGPDCEFVRVVPPFVLVLLLFCTFVINRGDDPQLNSGQLNTDIDTLLRFFYFYEDQRVQHLTLLVRMATY